MSTTISVVGKKKSNDNMLWNSRLDKYTFIEV